MRNLQQVASLIYLVHYHSFIPDWFSRSHTDLDLPESFYMSPILLESDGHNKFLWFVNNHAPNGQIKYYAKFFWYLVITITVCVFMYFIC